MHMMEYWGRDAAGRFVFDHGAIENGRAEVRLTQDQVKQRLEELSVLHEKSGLSSCQGQFQDALIEAIQEIEAGKLTAERLPPASEM